jgi:hydroxymethylglutaryl-CoA synthase
MLLTSNPSIISFKNTVGISMEHVGDFFKPRRKIDNSFLSDKNTTVQKLTNSDKEILDFYFEEPVFDGQYSNKCYQDRINEGLEHFQSQKKIDFLKEWDHLIFHLPYAFQGRRIMLDVWLHWLDKYGLMSDLEKEIGQSENMDYKDWRKAASKSILYKNFVESKIEDGEIASGYIGNMYTASIFMSLISLLCSSYEKDKNISGNNVGFLSYGSGSKSKIFEGRIAKDWRSKICGLEVFKKLEERKLIDFETYEKLHNGSLKIPISNNKNIVLERIDDQENKVGFRHYKIN